MRLRSGCPEAKQARHHAVRGIGLWSPRRKRSAVRLSFALVAVLLATAYGGCGGAASPPSGLSAAALGAAHATVTAAKQAVGALKGDNDDDGDGGLDDELWGKLASAGDRRAVAALVKRYFAAYAADDGRAACALLYASVAHEIPAVYDAEHPHVSCAQAVSRYFRLLQQRLPNQLGALAVVELRIEGRHGLVLLHARGGEKQIAVQRGPRQWKIDALLPDDLG